MLSNEEIKEKLEEITEELNTIKAIVAQDALEEMDNYSDIKDWFSDLLTHGCASGMIGGLIYYADTHRFYDENYEEIEELRLEYEEMTGETLHPEYDLKNWFAWFAYEETARKLADELELDI